MTAYSYVPKDGERFRVVELHPTHPTDAIGREFTRGTDCECWLGGAGDEDAWLVVKQRGACFFVRAEPVEQKAEEVATPEPVAVFKVGDFVEWIADGARWVGTVTVVRPSFMIAETLCRRSAQAAQEQFFHAWKPEYGELCEGKPTKESWAAGAEVVEGTYLPPRVGGVEGWAHLSVKAQLVAIELSSLRPARSRIHPTLSELVTPPVQPEPEPAPVAKPADHVPASAPRAALYVPKEHEWVRVTAVRPEPRQGVGIGSILKAAEAWVEGEWLRLVADGCLTPDRYSVYYCVVVPADELDILAGRRQREQRDREGEAAFRAMLPGLVTRRAPHDWEPPEDFALPR